MTMPKFLALDADMQVVGMASSREDFLRMGKFIGDKYYVYRLETSAPDREIAGLDALTKKVTKDGMADKS